MDFFDYHNQQLHAEDLPVSELVKQHGTPLYIYSQSTIERHWQAFDDAFAGRDHLICYSVKANSNLSILKRLKELGSGFDIVSGGELERIVAIGADPQTVVFSGVGKNDQEITRALELNIRCFNVESESELERIQSMAKSMGKKAPISLRVNPNVDAQTHPYISTGLKENKFGVSHQKAIDLYLKAAKMDAISIHGIDCHIGSQLTKTEPFVEAAKKILQLVNELKSHGIELKHIDLGGGLGVPYKGEVPPSPQQYIDALYQLQDLNNYQVLIEPGRAIIANAGILVGQVLHVKENEGKHFAIVDAAMNDLIRPSLYDAWMDAWPVKEQTQEVGDGSSYDIVGPICETGDFLAKDRKLKLSQGDLLAIKSAGAYGFTMASNYNTRPRAAEIMVKGGNSQLIGERESITDLLKRELNAINQ